MGTSVQMPSQAILRPVDDGDTALQNRPTIVPNGEQEEFSRIPGVENWNMPGTLAGSGLMKLVEYFLRQPNHSLPLPLFTRPHSLNDLRQNGHSNGQHSNFGNLTVQDSSASWKTRNTNTPHRRTSRPVRKHQRWKDLPRAGHERQKANLMAQLHPIVQESNSDCSHLLLCWGRKNQCKILAIKIPNSADDVAIWQMIRQAWYRHRGRWRRCIPALDVQRVDVVKVWLDGPSALASQ